MPDHDYPLPFRSPLEAYEARAQATLEKLHAGDNGTAWRFKWNHPRFRGKGVDAVRAATLDLDDARLLVAQEHHFNDWASLASYAHEMQSDGPDVWFEEAVEAVVAGDVAKLKGMLREDPDLVRKRASRRHHAALLHYIGANGVEDNRQRTPPNAVEVARALLDAGAEPDALADMYDNPCTTMSMLLTSSHPHEAGLQLPLAELLLDRGAAFEGPGKWGSSIMASLLFGYGDTAQALAKLRPPRDDFAAVAGLGWAADVARLLTRATADERHLALVLAAMHGHADVVRLLLDAGEDPDRYNPEGAHSHSTPLHQAVWGGHADVVRLLVDRGARLDMRDKLFDGTPRGWAEYGRRTDILPLLEGAPS